MIQWITDNPGIVVTVGLFTSFSLILLWAYLPSRKKNLQEQAMIPFKEQNND